MKLPGLAPALPVLLALACVGAPSGETGRATFGVRTSVPSQELAERMGLAFDVRVEGRLVEQVEPASAAEAAGIAPGDVLLELDGLPLFSQDDIEDVLRLSQPRREVTLQFQRAGERELREARVTLGRAPAPAATGPRLDWELLGFVALPRALERARAEKKQVLVGLSGAET